MVGVASSGLGAPAEAAARAERLWLVQLQRLAGGVSHELRNALNGVAVNLEVVRSRSERDGVPARSLASFAGSASDQLETVIAVTEALVSLARPARQPATVGRTADQILAVLRPPLAATGGSVTLEVEGEGSTTVAADVVRALVAAALIAAGDAAGPLAGAIRCRVRPAAGVRLEVIATGIGPLADEVLRVAADWAVGVRSDGERITLTFPA